MMSALWTTIHLLSLSKDKFGKTYGKIKHQWQLTEKYRGAAHSNINLETKQPKFTHTFFDNLSNCDSLFLFDTLQEKKKTDVKFDEIAEIGGIFLSIGYGC